MAFVFDDEPKKASTAFIFDEVDDDTSLPVELLLDPVEGPESEDKGELGKAWSRGTRGMVSGLAKGIKYAGHEIDMALPGTPGIKAARDYMVKEGKMDAPTNVAGQALVDYGAEGAKTWDEKAQAPELAADPALYEKPWWTPERLAVTTLEAAPLTVAAMGIGALTTLATCNPFLGAAVSGVLFGGTSAGEVLEEAMAHGLTVEEALPAARLAGAGEAALEFVPGWMFMKMIGKIPMSKEMTMKGLKELFRLRNIAKAVGKMTIAESLEEGLQTTKDNLIARGYYDSERAILQDVPESMVVGAIMGGVLGGSGGSVNLARRAAQLKAIKAQVEGLSDTKLPPEQKTAVMKELDAEIYKVENEATIEEGKTAFIFDDEVTDAAKATEVGGEVRGPWVRSEEGEGKSPEGVEPAPKEGGAEAIEGLIKETPEEVGTRIKAFYKGMKGKSHEFIHKKTGIKVSTSDLTKVDSLLATKMEIMEGHTKSMEKKAADRKADLTDDAEDARRYEAAQVARKEAVKARQDTWQNSRDLIHHPYFPTNAMDFQKQKDGSYKAIYVYNDADLFPGKTFPSHIEAQEYFEDQRGKAQDAYQKKHGKKIKVVEGDGYSYQVTEPAEPKKTGKEKTWGGKTAEEIFAMGKGDRRTFEDALIMVEPLEDLIERSEALDKLDDAAYAERATAEQEKKAEEKAAYLEELRPIATKMAQSERQPWLNDFKKYHDLIKKEQKKTISQKAKDRNIAKYQRLLDTANLARSIYVESLEEPKPKKKKAPFKSEFMEIQEAPKAKKKEAEQQTLIEVQPTLPTGKLKAKVPQKEGFKMAEDIAEMKAEDDQGKLFQGKGRPTIADIIAKKVVAVSKTGAAKITPKKAQFIGQWYEAFFTTMGKREGRDPRLLFEKYKINVLEGTPPQPVRKKRKGKRKTLGEFIRSKIVGGLNITDDALASEIRIIREGFPGLVNKNGKGVDDATQMAISYGYLPEGSTVNDFIAALTEDVGFKVSGTGKAWYSTEDADSEAEIDAAMKEGWEAQADAILDSLGGRTTAEEYADMDNEADPDDETFFQAGAPKTLSVVHNLSLKNLLHSQRMGGIAVPSIAIVDSEKSPYTSYGEITLLGTKELIDPRKSKKNKVYGSDIYSQRYPSVVNTIDYKGMDAENKKVAHIVKAMKPESEFAQPTLEISQLENKGLEQTLEWEAAAITAGFLESKGILWSVETYDDGEFNRSRTASVLYEKAKEVDGWEEFVEDLRSKVIKKERIFRGFTDAGDRKWLDHNLDNVVREMKGDPRGGESFNYGIGTIRSKVSKQFKSIKEIKDHQDRLVTGEDMQEVKDETHDEFGTLTDWFYPKRIHRGDAYGFMDSFSEHLMEIVDTRDTRGTLKEYYNFIEDEDVELVDYFLNSLRDMPTEYFEVKIQRAVKVGEFAAAVLPIGKDYDKAAKILKAEGISDIRRYDPTNSDSRKKAVNKTKDIFFQSEKDNTWYYSHLRRVVESDMRDKIGVNEIPGFMRSRNVKKTELKWSGINGLIQEAKSKGQKSVTKKEVLDVLDLSAITLEKKVRVKPHDLIVERHIPKRTEKELRDAAEDIMHMGYDELTDAGRWTLTQRMHEREVVRHPIDGMDYGDQLVTEKWDLFDATAGKIIGTFDSWKEAHDKEIELANKTDVNDIPKYDHGFAKPLVLPGGHDQVEFLIKLPRQDVGVKYWGKLQFPTEGMWRTSLPICLLPVLST